MFQSTKSKMAAKYTNKLKVQDKFTCVLKDTCSGSPFWHFGCHVVVVVFCLFVCFLCKQQGVYKSWKVLEFYHGIFQDFLVLEIYKLL